ncbi:MAG: c-type cytochrome [Myxococcales bacterium]
MAALAACAARPPQARVSRSLALSADGASLWVVNPESDSISQIDLASRTLKAEVPLSANPPGVDAAGDYAPAVRPRAIALVDSLHLAYVAGQAANEILVVDTAAGRLLRTIPVGAEPTAVVASEDGTAVYAVDHQAAAVEKIDTATDTVIATVSVGGQPWGAALRAGGDALYVTQFLQDAGVAVVDTAPLALAGFLPLANQPPDPTGNPQYPNGQVRAAYAVVPRPGVDELWVPHELSASQTPQPALTFDSAVFPAISRIEGGGTALASTGTVDNRLLYQPPMSVLGLRGTFNDSVCGPRDVAFTPDGAFALVAMAQSEDVMVFDANSGDEVGLVRPTPSALLEGITVDAAGTHAYVAGRSSHNVTVLDIARANGGIAVSPGGDAIECLAADPMPTQLRKGMRLFYSANSAQFPITRSFWLACASCHPEGQTDAVTWQLSQGPRDTPSLAGGPVHTGFLMRQALLTDVVQLDGLVQALQGGSYDRNDPAELPDLEALAAFVNHAIPFPNGPPPSPGASPSNGQALFAQHCASCHAGPYFTDSGQGNPTLDLAGPIVLHDVGACVVGGAFPDQPALDAAGKLHAACELDTPTLRGIFATPPYLHDGSAPTLDDAVAQQLEYLGAHGDPAAGGLGAADRADLVAFLETL